MRITFCTFVTPTRERLTCAVGRRAWTSSEEAPSRLIRASEDSALALVRYGRIGCMVADRPGCEGTRTIVIRKAHVPAGLGSRDIVRWGSDVEHEGRRRH